MNAILSLIIVVLCTLGFITDSRAFESKLFQALAEIKKVSTEAHSNKEYLAPETIIKHEKLRIQVMGLIDGIISEIQDEKPTNLKEELLNINEPLKEVQLYLERDEKDTSKIKNFSHQSPYASFRSPHLAFDPITLSLEIINNITEEVRETRKETRDIKKDRIGRLEKYNWDPIQK